MMTKYFLESSESPGSYVTFFVLLHSFYTPSSFLWYNFKDCKKITSE